MVLVLQEEDYRVKGLESFWRTDDSRLHFWDGSLQNIRTLAMMSPLMIRTHLRPLTNAELRVELEAMNTIFFVGQPLSWQDIERQVERLGFGELYIVSAMQRPNESAMISLKPVRPKQSVPSRAAA